MNAGSLAKAHDRCNNRCFTNAGFNVPVPLTPFPKRPNKNLSGNKAKKSSSLLLNSHIGVSVVRRAWTSTKPASPVPASSDCGVCIVKLPPSKLLAPTAGVSMPLIVDSILPSSVSISLQTSSLLPSVLFLFCFFPRNVFLNSSRQFLVCASPPPYMSL